MNYKKIIFAVSFLAIFGFLFSFSTPSAEATILVSAPSITFTLPKEGENLSANTSYTVAWGSANLVSGDIRLYYRLNGGDWKYVSALPITATTYSWNVPSLEGEAVLFIGNWVNNRWGETSKHIVNFNIIKQATEAADTSITFTLPKEGENLSANTSYTVAWGSANLVSGDIRLYYRLNGGDWKYVSALPITATTYSWNVPSLEGKAVLFIGNWVNNRWGETSKHIVNFNIIKQDTEAADPSITFTLPKEGENLSANTSYTVAWESANLVSGDIRLYYRLNSGDWKYVSALPITATTYSWNVPSLEGKAVLFIGNWVNNRWGETSKHIVNFNIIKQATEAADTSITFTLPKEGENLSANTSYTVAWGSANLVSGDIRLYYRLNGGDWKYVSALPITATTYSWNVPSLEGKAVLFIGNWVNNRWGETSKHIVNFNIIKQATEAADTSITFTLPKEGENLSANTSYTVAWGSANLVSGDIRLYYRLNGGDWKYISALPITATTYSWNVPSLEGKAVLFIGNWVNNRWGETSKHIVNFNIIKQDTEAADPSITFTLPKEGENLSANTSYTVAWESANLVSGDIRLYYRLNSGDWKYVSALPITATTYSWNVPSLEGEAVLFIGNWVNNRWGETSKHIVNFNIIKQAAEAADTSITFTLPKEGENLSANTSYTVAWGSANLVSGDIRLYYRLNSGDWKYVSALPITATTYSWNVPSLEGKAVLFIGNWVNNRWGETSKHIVNFNIIKQAAEAADTSITFTLPKEGENLSANTSYTVAWGSANLVSGDIRLYYRLNGGDWKYISALPITATTYSWNVPSLEGKAVLFIGNWVNNRWGETSKHIVNFNIIK